MRNWLASVEGNDFLFGKENSGERQGKNDFWTEIEKQSGAGEEKQIHVKGQLRDKIMSTRSGRTRCSFPAEKDGIGVPTPSVFCFKGYTVPLPLPQRRFQRSGYGGRSASRPCRSRLLWRTAPQRKQGLYLRGQNPFPDPDK